MQILSTQQVRAWDEYTILHEPVTSINLMERAASACYEWLMRNGYEGQSFSVFCGKGNNGGDGLAIARMLVQSDHAVSVFIMEFGHKGTDDFQANLAALHDTKATIKFISSETPLYPINKDDIIIDALLGSGINRPVDGLTAQVIEHINQSGNAAIAIDIPSGLYVDSSSVGNAVIRATHTLTFQCLKLAFMVAENAPYTGRIHVLDIGLHPGFLQQNASRFILIDKTVVRGIIQPREPFSNKGTFGNAALIAGSKGMMGAATLAARACMRSGAGKLTCHIPEAGYVIMQVTVPEAMSKTEPGTDYIQSVSSLEKYDAVGMGPGLGQHASHAAWLPAVFEQYRHPMVIDADALNVLSANRHLLQQVPPLSILTPHPLEFERLFGKSANDFEQMQLALQQAAQYNVLILLKGHHTFIATPTGAGFFNSTGNAGMATAGTGDVLTGMLTGLLAQGYTPQQAAVAGVWLHGSAADLAVAYTSQPSLIASDIIDHLGDAFHQLYE
jgi:hydroxyethylthiazole kinase-like uncharacterized protein yjeF